MRKLRGLLPAIVIGIMGNGVIYLIPLLLGAMVSDRGFTEQEAGFMASADITGYAFATVVTAVALDKISWRQMALGAVALMIAANIGTTFIRLRGRSIRPSPVCQRPGRWRAGGARDGLAWPDRQTRPQLRLDVCRDSPVQYGWFMVPTAPA